MPILSQSTTNIQKIYLASTINLPEEDKAWVELDLSELLAGDVLDMMNAGSDIKTGEMSGELLTSRIKAWNFTEPDGVTPAQINIENVRHLPKDDLTQLLGLLANVTNTNDQALSTDQKKT